MADSPVTIDSLKPLQVRLNLTAQVTFNWQFAGSDRMDDVIQLLGGQILRADIRIDVCLFENSFRGLRANPVNVWQRCFDAFVSGNLNS